MTELSHLVAGRGHGRRRIFTVRSRYLATISDSVGAAVIFRMCILVRPLELVVVTINKLSTNLKPCLVTDRTSSNISQVLL
jgi:hypothetical protein